MIGSFYPSGTIVASVGLTLFALILFQMLLGYKKVKFKGRLHWRVHRWVAWVIVGLGLVHGTLAFAFLGWWPF